MSRIAPRRRCRNPGATVRSLSAEVQENAVSVHRYDCVSHRISVARTPVHLVSKVTRQTDSFDARVCLMEILNDLPGSIYAPIVDHDNFVVKLLDSGE